MGGHVRSLQNFKRFVRKDEMKFFQRRVVSTRGHDLKLFKNELN